MTYTFKPKNFTESYLWFTQLPFYKFSDLKNRNGINFLPNEIKLIEIVSENKNMLYAVSYEKSQFYGKFVTYQIPVNFPLDKVEKNAKPWNRDLLIYFLKTIYKNSPTLLYVLSVFGVGLLVPLLSNTLVSFFWPPETFINLNCDLVCVNKIFSIYATALLLISSSVFPLLSLFLFYRWRLPQIRRGEIYHLFRVETFFLGVVGVLLLANLLLSFFQTTTYDKLWTLHHKLHGGRIEMSSKSAN